MRYSPLRLLAHSPLLLAALVATSISSQTACASTNSSGPAPTPPVLIPALGPGLPIMGTARARSGSSVFTNTSQPPVKYLGAAKDNVSVPPPGLVLIPGGRTIIGTDADDIEDLLREHYSERKNAGAYVSETPQHKKEVSEFALMVTEVTNEQFAAYVSATGNRPPELWGTKAIQVAANEFLVEQGKRRKKAKEEGKKQEVRKKFDGQAWWGKNWKDAEWEIPKGHDHKPVVYVTYEDAQNYSRWAGLRLMTEFEYQRAVRGKTDNSYPWGENWVKGNAVTSDLEGNAETRVVGSIEAGASKEGVYDLIGNAWEWTSSPYVQFPKYKAQRFKVEKGRDAVPIDGVANWDANKRVSVGGGYHANQFVARCTTRRGASRSQTADTLAFRCAASLVPGIDIAERLMTDELDVGSRPKSQDGAVQYAPTDTLAIDRWAFRSLSDDERPAPGYEVITGYDYVIFTPVDKVYSVDVNDLKKRILDGMPEPIGFLSTNQRILSPDLQPGTYMISYRCDGERRGDNSLAGKGKNAAEPSEDEEPEPIDPWDLGQYEAELGLEEDKDYFLFFNDRAEVVGVIEAHGFDKKAGKIKSAGSARFFDKDYTVEEEDENGDKVEVQVHEQWLRFDANLRARAARRGFVATIAIQVENDLDASSFRMSTE